MKKVLKWAGIAIGSLLAVTIILSLLFYFPPFQNWAVGEVTAYASEKTGMQMSVGRVHLAFPLDLALEDVRALEPSRSLAHPTDTVADIRQVVVNVQLLPLLRKRVMIDELSLDQAHINTTHFIDNVRVKGKVGSLKVAAHGIDLSDGLVHVDKAHIADGDLLVELSDTVPKDTTPSENRWKISIAHLKAERTAFTLRTPGDTMAIAAYLGSTTAKQTYLDLGKGLYTIQHLAWNHGELSYDQTLSPLLKGFDANHLSLTGLTLRADSFYFCDSKIDVRIRQALFKEKSGLEVNQLAGSFCMDSTRLSLPMLHLRTPNSSLRLNFAMDLNAFDEQHPGKLEATVHGFVGKWDLATLAGASLPKGMALLWPNQPLRIDGSLRGNMQKAHLKRLSIELPTAFTAKADGFVANLTHADRLKADIDLSASTHDLSFLTSLLDPSLTRTIRIPSGIGFKGNIRVDGAAIASTFVATQGGGTLRGHGSIDTKRMAYDAQLAAQCLPLQHFVPHMGLHPFTGHIQAHGVGTDFLSPNTRLEARASVDKFRFEANNLDNVKAAASVHGGHIRADIDSHNPLVKGAVSLDAIVSQRFIRGTVACDLDRADLYNLRLAEEPLSVALCGHVDIATDLNKYYKVQGLVSDITVKDKEKCYRPEDVVLDVLTARDTTHAIADCGDFHLNMDAGIGYERLLSTAERIKNEMRRQLKARHLNLPALRRTLPHARVHLTSGQANIVSRILKRRGYDLRNVFMDMASSPTTGLNGRLQLDSLVAGGVQIDTIRARVLSDDSTTTYTAQLHNGKDNPFYTFNALFDGAFNERGTYVKARIYDAQDQLGIRMGLQASMHEHGISLHLFDGKPILGYKEFAANDSNYLYLGDDQRVRADMKLTAEDGTGVQIYTDDSNATALQDITVNLHHFDLGRVLGVLPFTPNVTGIFDGDFHLVQEPGQLSVSSSVNVTSLTYEECPMGNVGAEFTYMPKSDGSHYVDGILTQGGAEIGTLTGTYQSEGDGHLDAKLDLARTPLDLINGFIPDKIIGFKGYGEGTLTVTGSLSRPDVNGEVFLDSCYMFSEPYGVQVRFANDPVAIHNSRLLFENFEVYANNDSPLNLAGYFDFAHTDQMRMDVRMRAENYLLVDAKETNRSEAYGKGYVNFYGTMRGMLDNLKVRGRVDVLGATDLKYNLKDSPLSTDNQLEGLVEFTNFNDTTTDVINRPPVSGLDVDLSLNIDDGAHIDCFLNAAKTNYVDVIGGGTMRMQYNIADGVTLRGRYTIGSGEMKYSLPVIPLKTFTIAEGSYIEFTGDPMNPRLSLSATETTKSAVGSEAGNGRMVEFTCGVNVTKTLQDMGLEFTIDAPEDMTVHNQLQAMSKEERGKMAVTMLTTGMYLAEGNTSSFTMNSALSAFLNSQINQISSKALRTLDVGFGVDNSFAGGNVHTDYSFKFAKRFWNNRVKISIGGKLSTGADVAAQNETFFDNVSLEYRISPVSNQYLNLFYVRDSYDWLEGNVSKFGGGFIWRRKLRHFKDLFHFKADKGDTLPPDSAKNTQKKR